MKKLWTVFIIAVILIVSFLGFKYYEKVQHEKSNIKKHDKLVADIDNYYYKYAISSKDTDLYKKTNNTFTKSGKISKDFVMEIEKSEKEDIPYYKIKDTEYYIYFKDIKKYTNDVNSENRYKNFIPFDSNVIINSNKKIYLADGSYLITDKDINTPLIINDDEKYGFEYLDRLFFVDKENASLNDNHNNDENKAKKILTLTYHFIYDPEEEKCNQSICQKLEQFESHLKYLTENNYFIMKLDELELYLDGKINVPKNSIVLTIDDGYISEKAIRLLEQYKAHATLFIITGNFSDFSKFKSPYLDLQSHTDSMHKQWECGSMGNQGGGLLCKEEQKAIDDIKLSQEKLGGDTKIVYLSYPFFDFNDHAISILKKSGIKMAFIGQWNVKGFSTVGTNKYKVPRLTVFNDTSVEKLKQALAY